MTSRVKDRGCNVTSSVLRVFVHNSTQHSHRSTNIGKKVVHATGYIAHQFQGESKVKVTDGQMTFKTPLAGAGAHCSGLPPCPSPHLAIFKFLSTEHHAASVRYPMFAYFCRVGDSSISGISGAAETITLGPSFLPTR